MRKITKEEFDSISYVKGSNPAVQEILKMNVGDALIISKEEWRTKTKPGNLMAQYAARYQKKWSFRTLEDGSGWCVLRIK